MTTMTTMVRAAVCADDPVSLAGLAAELAACRGIEVVDDTDAADVVVIVVHEVDEQTTQLTRRLRRAGVVGVVLVVAQINDHGLFAAVEAGVSGLLRRTEATPERLGQAIDEAAQGNGVMPSDLLGRLMQNVNHLHDRVLGPQGMHLNGLSDREIEVLRLVAEGHATSDIAATLCYSERTIKNVIQGITMRLNLRNRSHAVAYAMRHGLI
jgi:DNA-binding NarL/FixJ family response regulator